MLGVGGSGEGAGGVAADDVVAADRADGDDFADVGGEGAGFWPLGELLALAADCLGGEEAAVGGGDAAFGDALEPLGKGCERAFVGEEVGSGEAGAVGGAGLAAAEARVPRCAQLGALGGDGEAPVGAVGGECGRGNGGECAGHGV